MLSAILIWVSAFFKASLASLTSSFVEFLSSIIFWSPCVKPWLYKEIFSICFLDLFWSYLDSLSANSSLFTSLIFTFGAPCSSAMLAISCMVCILSLVYFWTSAGLYFFNILSFWIKYSALFSTSFFNSACFCSGDNLSFNCISSAFLRKS